MQINLDVPQTKYQITKCDPGCVTVNGHDYTSSILVMPDTLQEWNITSVAQLQEKHFIELLKLNPDVIILGTGEHLLFPEDSILQTIEKDHIGVEVMNTAAACRTFAVLAAEGRKVLAALIVEAKQN